MARREADRLAAAGSKSAGEAAWFHDPDATMRSIPRRTDSMLPFDPALMPRDLRNLMLRDLRNEIEVADEMPDRSSDGRFGLQWLHFAIVRR